MSDQCSVGVSLKYLCIKQSYCRKTGLKELESFPSDDREVIIWRSGLSSINKNATNCCHHEQTILQRFSSLQKGCFGPFKIHKTVVAKGL